MKTKLLLAVCIAFFGCSGDNDSPADGNSPDSISNTLHMSFTTSDWDRFINCEKLDLYPVSVNETTSTVSATSASTAETFCFSIPVDSSAMVSPSNLKKYAIATYFDNSAPFQFSQKLPVTSGSSTYLVSIGGLTEESYNEVTEIKYIGKETNYSLFTVKCRYKMLAYPIGDETTVKAISGTFHFKVRTSRK